MKSKIRASLIVFICFYSLLGCACANSELKKRVMSSESYFQKKCLLVAEDYVGKTRGWRRENYQMIPVQSELGGEAFSVVYLPGVNSSASAGNRESFHLELDKNCSKLITELGYQ